MTILQTPLIVGTSHSLSRLALSCESSRASSSSANALATTPSIYVTFKVLQLVNSLRKRVKTRKHCRIAPKKEVSHRLTHIFCQDFERQAFDEIDHYLGRKPFRPRTQRRKPTAARTKLVVEGAPAENTEWYLEQIDQAVKSQSLPISEVAFCNKLFVERREDFALTQQRLSIAQLATLSVTIKDLLRTLRKSPPSRIAKAECEGDAFDVNYLANLEHLLLCLKNHVLRILIARLIELAHKHLAETQQTRRKQCEDWFFEFPDARHPLSTTWPWSIRPSLAVIWGVCWMFYDSYNTHRWSPESYRFDEHGNMVNAQGEVVAESQAFSHFASNPHQPSYTYFSGQEILRAMPRQAQAGTGPGYLPRSVHSATAAQPQFTQTSSSPSYQAPRAASHASSGVGVGVQSTHNNNTYPPAAYSAAPPRSAVASDASNWQHFSGVLPQDFTGFEYPDNAPYAAQTWNQLPANSLAEQQQPALGSWGVLPPQNSRSSHPPQIRLDTTDLPTFAQRPEDINHSATSVSSNASFAPHTPVNYYNAYGGPHLNTPTANYMNPAPANPRTPPRSPTHDPAMADTTTRKRSHSEMSGGPPEVIYAGANSGESRHASHSADEGYSPRNHTLKRPDPPMNADNKYICDHMPECAGYTFDRKCEWSKHMDKHDRPYQCQHPSCGKLQGFTYSGGLLRHEREVHGKHGGPKSALVCPYPDCKRHAGKGFTRKENLNEHVRRVHQNKNDLTEGRGIKRDSNHVVAGAEDMDEAPVSASDGGVADYPYPTSPTKRRRVDPRLEDGASAEIENLKNELYAMSEQLNAANAHIAHLQAENATMHQAHSQQQAPQHEQQNDVQV